MMKRILFCVGCYFSLSANAAVITQTEFLGLSNIATPSISCVAPKSGSPAGTCSVNTVGVETRISQAGKRGAEFTRFDNSLGTLNSVNIDYQFDARGVWISRPEDIAPPFSVSTDFEYKTSFVLNLPNIDRVGFFERTGSYTRSTHPLTSRWTIDVDGSKTYTDSDDLFEFTRLGVFNPNTPLTLIVSYFLEASLDGNGLDCTLGTASCGTTNRIEQFSGARFTLTYDYTPATVVPVPAAAWLFGSALMGLGVIGRTKAR